MRFPKKLTALGLTAVMALGCAACGAQPRPAQSAAPTPTEAVAAAPTATAAPTPQPAAALSPEGSVLFERDGLKITTAGLGTDPTAGRPEPIIWLDVENTGNKDMFPGVSGGSVNGFMTGVFFIEFFLEDGVYTGANCDSTMRIPAGSSGRYALGYNQPQIPGLDLSTLGEIECCFTLADDEFTWPSYTSAPVTVSTGEKVEMPDVDGMDHKVVDNDTLTLVIGPQDYDDFLGPEVYVYARNKTDHYIGISAESAEADGSKSDYILYSASVAPGKCSADFMTFEGPVRELKGFEKLAVSFRIYEAKDLDSLSEGESATLDPVTVEYPPQVWGEFENGGTRLSLTPKFNSLVTVETPENDPDGILFRATENASRDAGGSDGDGMGWLFSIGAVSEEKLHQMLCDDMSGAEVFAKNAEGTYYVKYHPTDLRYARATPEEMARVQEQWTMVTEWAEMVPDRFAENNDLERVSYGNSAIDMALARAAYREGTKYSLSTQEYGPLEGKNADAIPYVEFLMKGWYMDAEDQQTPDGEYISLDFPEDGLRLDFFRAEGGYVRAVSGDTERLYQAGWYDDNISFAEAVQGWYYALAEQAGLRQPDTALTPFLGTWAEKIAGRGMVTVSRTLAPGKVQINASWPESAAVMDTWEIVARLTEGGKLVYENGTYTSTEYTSEGDSSVIDERWGENGSFYLDGGDLRWHNEWEGNPNEDSAFQLVK